MTSQARRQAGSGVRRALAVSLFGGAIVLAVGVHLFEARTLRQAAESLEEGLDVAGLARLQPGWTRSAVPIPTLAAPALRLARQDDRNGRLLLRTGRVVLRPDVLPDNGATLAIDGPITIDAATLFGSSLPVRLALARFTVRLGAMPETLAAFVAGATPRAGSNGRTAQARIVCAGGDPAFAIRIDDGANSGAGSPTTIKLRAPVPPHGRWSIDIVGPSVVAGADLTPDDTDPAAASLRLRGQWPTMIGALRRLGVLTGPEAATAAGIAAFLAVDGADPVLPVRLEHGSVLVGDLAIAGSGPLTVGGLRRLSEWLGGAIVGRCSTPAT